MFDSDEADLVIEDEADSNIDTADEDSNGMCIMGSSQLHTNNKLRTFIRMITQKRRMGCIGVMRIPIPERPYTSNRHEWREGSNERAVSTWELVKTLTMIVAMNSVVKMVLTCILRNGVKTKTMNSTGTGSGDRWSKGLDDNRCHFAIL